MEKVVIPGKLDWGGGCQTWTMRSTSRKGSGSRRTLLTMLKMAVLAPMPRAMMMAAIRAKPGFFLSNRSAKRRSCRSAGMRLPHWRGEQFRRHGVEGRSSGLSALFMREGEELVSVDENQRPFSNTCSYHRNGCDVWACG